MDRGNVGGTQNVEEDGKVNAAALMPQGFLQLRSLSQCVEMSFVAEGPQIPSWQPICLIGQSYIMQMHAWFQLYGSLLRPEFRDGFQSFLRLMSQYLELARHRQTKKRDYRPSVRRTVSVVIGIVVLIVFSRQIKSVGFF